MNNNLRPDELASLSEIEKSQSRDKSLKRGVKTAVGIGTAALGAGLSSKILPFLNEHIPTDLAWKGINKVVPEVGKFLKKGLSYGLDLKSGLDYLKKSIDPSSNSNTNTAPEQRSIIEQYSPELFQFLKGEIDKGRAPLEAGALAQLQEPFKKIIKKMSEDHKAPFSSILQSVFGGSQQAQQPQNQQSVINPNQSAEAAAFSNLKSQSQQPHPNSARGQQLARQQQQGNGDQALLAAFDNLLKM